MPSISIPFLTSETNYVLAIPVDDLEILFDIRWNSRDEAWYMDMYESNDTPIAINVKIVTGICLGRRSSHSFFLDHKVMAIDTSGTGQNPGFDDLGKRIIVTVQNASDLA